MTSMELIPKDSVLFRNAVEALVSFLPQASLRFSSEGLAINGMDVSHVGFVDYFLAAADCDSLKVPAPLTIGITTSVLARTLAAVGAGDRVTISVNAARDKLAVSYYNEKVGKRAVYSINTLDIDEDALELPENMMYAASVEAKTADVVGIVREVGAFGDTMGFLLDEEGFHVSCKGDAGTVTQTLMNTDDRTMELTEDTVTANNGKAYIMNILKGGGSLATTMKIEFDSSQPMRAGFQFGSGSRFVAYLAPKVMED